MEAKEFVGGGACLKARLKVKYEKPSEELHEKLFCKYPFQPNEETFRNSWQWITFSNNDGPEIDFARMLSAGAPFKCPKYYFGDICPISGANILITECLDFPEEGADYGPWELEPIPHKAVDYLLDDPFSYYAAIVRNSARLAAWGYTGKLGKDVLVQFHPPTVPVMFAMGVKMKIPKYLKFVREVAPQLFDQSWFSQEFEDSLNDCLLDVEKSQKAIYEYLYTKDQAMIGLTHQNMNIDNAFFWRDGEGNIESGFIDWGRFKQGNYSESLINGFSCCDLPDFTVAQGRNLIQVFCDVFAEEAVPGVVTFDKMWEHYMLSWTVQCLFLVNLADFGIYPAWHWTRPEEWKNIKDYTDPRVYNMPNTNCGWVAMLRQFTWQFKKNGLADFWKKWRLEKLGPKPEPPKPKAKKKN